MIRTSFDLGGASVSVQLTKAILLYSGSTGSAATVHEIARDRTGPVIQPGVGLGKAELHQILLALLGSRSKALFLPESILCLSPTQMAWWCQSQNCEIFFKARDADDKVNKLSGKKVQHPNLVFVATPGKLRVFALAKAERPTPETKLYVAPYWNVFRDGHMCQGDVKYPESLLPQNLQAFEAAFFDSIFTHAEVNPLTRHPKGHHGFWSDLRRVKTIPAKWLVPCGKTLMEVLEYAQA